jgi:hypothetical protein
MVHLTHFAPGISSRNHEIRGQSGDAINDKPQGTCDPVRYRAAARLNYGPAVAPRRPNAVFDPHFPSPRSVARVRDITVS